MPLYQPHTHLNLYLEFSWHCYPTGSNGPSVLHRRTHFMLWECFGRKFMKSIDIMTSCKHLVCVSCQSGLKYCMDLIKFGKVFCLWVDWKIFITQNRCNVLKAVLHLCYNICCLSFLLRLVSNDALLLATLMGIRLTGWRVHHLHHTEISQLFSWIALKCWQAFLMPGG